jgi:hypothetical protein
MNPILKNVIWDFWAWILAGLAVADWHAGKLDGYWAWVICWLAFCYVVESTMRSAATWYHSRS